MVKIKSLDKQKLHSVIFKIICVFIIAQPIFDILSFLNIRGYVNIGISTYLKPLIIGLVNIALMLIYKKQIWRCGITYVSYLALVIVHTFLLKGMLIESSVILHEIRFMINILYFLICYHDFRILCDEAADKDAFASQLKKVLIITFGVYIVFYLLAVATGTSGMSYEYSDSYKAGFKGWMDSGQIFGHAFCICLPFIFASVLNNKIKKPWLNVLCKFGVALPLVVLCMLGTKVSYYIAILVPAAQVVLELIFAVAKKQKSHYLNAAICVACVAAAVLVYPITPVKHNTDINNSVLSLEHNNEQILQIIEQEKNKHHIDDTVVSEKDENQTTSKPNQSNQSDKNHQHNQPVRTEAIKNSEWTLEALSVLEQKYADGEIHYSDMRNRQLVFNYEKFKRADLKYKLFGIGYVVNGDMAIERDVLCVFFSFGIIGFIIVLLRPILIWFKSAFVILKRLFKANIETLCLFEGFSMFFFISWYAGATFIYTNFSIFLAIIMCLLNYNVNRLKNLERKND